MNDFAASPIQPVVNGLITIVAAAPVFSGRGVSAIARTVGGALLGDFTLTLDAGLPGNAGEFQPGAPEVRSSINARGSATNAVPGGTSIAAEGISYITPGVDGGDTQVRIVLTNQAGAAIDPTGANASGVELLIWKGV